MCMCMCVLLPVSVYVVFMSFCPLVGCVHFGGRWEGWFAASSEQISSRFSNEELPLHGGHRLMVHGCAAGVTMMCMGCRVRCWGRHDVHGL